jgi:hypothetical protein
VKVDNRRAAEILDHANDARDGGCLCGECGGSIREREDLLSDRAEMIEVIRRLVRFAIAANHGEEIALGIHSGGHGPEIEAAEALLASAEGAKEGTTVKAREYCETCHNGEGSGWQERPDPWTCPDCGHTYGTAAGAP